MGKREWKIVAATVTVIGVLFGILDSIFAPNYYVDETGLPGHNFMALMKLIMTSIAPIAYIVIDHWEDIKKKAGKYIH